jgi:hypothetical protein
MLIVERFVHTAPIIPTWLAGRKLSLHTALHVAFAGYIVEASEGLIQRHAYLMNTFCYLGNIKWPAPVNEIGRALGRPSDV